MEGLQQDHVASAVKKCGDLFPKHRLPIDATFRRLTDWNSQRTDTSCYPSLPARSVDGFACQLGCCPVDLHDVGLQSEVCQLEQVGTEGLGRDQRCARSEVFAMDPRDEFGACEAEFLEAASRGDAPLGEESSHRPVAAENPLLQCG